MSVTVDQVRDLVTTLIERSRQEFPREIQNLSAAIQALQPPSVETFRPLSIQPNIGEAHTGLDLVKSLPGFQGDSTTYPAWRAAALFAMDHHTPGSETFYTATDILRNKITGTANAALTVFNTVLNHKAIIARLDQTYSDKRPLYVLENELSILRQGNLSITNYYDTVERQLTLILNKNIMTNTDNSPLAVTLNERARESALRVFISGLRRPLFDILFSSRPADLPTVLAKAQELEVKHKRLEKFVQGSF